MQLLHFNGSEVDSDLRMRLICFACFTVVPKRILKDYYAITVPWYGV